MLRSWREDLRFVVRGLRRAPAFTIAAVLTLSAGTVATLVVFALVRSVLWRPLPVRDQQRLVLAWRDLPASGYAHHPFGDRAIARAAGEARLFDGVAGVDTNGVGREVLVEDGVASTVNGALVTGSFFDVLGVTPVLGRALTPADDVEGAEPVLVIREALWRSRYGASPAVLGRRVTLGERRFTIVGVMPADLDYPVGVDLWRATRTVPTTGPFGDAARYEIDLLARLRPGVTVDAASSALQALLRHLDADAPDGAPGSVPNVRRFEDAIVGPVRQPLLALLAAVALVLAVACANVANLQLMRAEGRRSELAVHAALGAGWSRLLRHVVLQTLVLSAAAAALGLPVAWWSLQAVAALLPGTMPRLDAVRIDAVVVGFAALLPVLMTSISALPTALFVRPRSIAEALGHGARLAPRAARYRRALVVAQVALAVMIVAAAGALVRGVVGLQSVPTGLDEERLLFAELSLSGAAADRARHAQVLEAVVARVQALPGVVAATPIDAWPYAGSWDVPIFTAQGQDAATAAVNPSLNFEAIGPRHFETLGTPLVQGRAFSPDDRAGRPLVALVSADVAARVWPGASAVGRRLKIGGPASTEPWLTVVGVVAETRYRELAAPRPTLYLPAAQFLDTAERLAIRTSVPPASVAPAIRGQVEGADPGVRVLRVATFEAIVAGPLAQPRFHATVSGAFAMAAAMLAALGLYAVLAASVAQRTREIAIRMAVGATPRRVGRLIVSEALWLAGIGAVVGSGAAVLMARLPIAASPGAALDDPIMLAGAAALLLAASTLAAYWPARRATRVDPVVSLRA